MCSSDLFSVQSGQQIQGRLDSTLGLFIVIVGLKGAGIVIGDQSTLVTLGNFATPQMVLALVGLMIIAILHHYKVKENCRDSFEDPLDLIRRNLLQQHVLLGRRYP